LLFGVNEKAFRIGVLGLCCRFTEPSIGLAARLREPLEESSLKTDASPATLGGRLRACLLSREPDAFPVSGTLATLCAYPEIPFPLTPEHLFL
jgi:hypothetical protein